MRPPTLDQVSNLLVRAWADGDAHTAARWTEQVDMLDPARRAAPPSLPGAALWYAEHGIHVFPLSPGRKTPLPRTHGLKDATTDPDQIHAWWARVPTANIGIATGHAVDVVDIDGLPGNLSLARDAVPGLLDVLRATSLGQVSTPRPGGRHYYIPGSGHRNRAALAHGIDYRGTGGYVVAPPSRINPGAKDHPGTYRWTTPPNLEGAA